MDSYAVPMPSRCHPRRGVQICFHAANSPDVGAAQRRSTPDSRRREAGVGEGAQAVEGAERLGVVGAEAGGAGGGGGF